MHATPVRALRGYNRYKQNNAAKNKDFFTTTRTRGLCGLREFYHANFQQIHFEMHHIKHPEEEKREIW